MHKTLLAISAAALGTLTQSAMAADCGEVSIAEMNWPTAQLAAHVDRFILEHGYGCDAHIVPGDTVPTATSMSEKARPDIAPEMWMNMVQEPLQKAVDAGRLVIAGDILENPAENAGEGWWIPQYMLDKNPELATIEGIKKHPELFADPENPGRAYMLGCPSGWTCQIATDNLYRAFKMDDAGFNLVDPGSGAAMAGAIGRAYNRGEGLLTYYWAPTSVLARYDMARVDFEVDHDPESYDACISQADCPNPAPNNFPVSEIKTVVATSFSNNNPEVMTYLKNRVWRGQDYNEMLMFMEDTQADGEVAAEEFFNNYEDSWRAWLPEDVAQRVKDAL